MEVLLLSNITGIGQKNDLLTVASGYALNCLLPQRLAIVATPKVRKQYAELIKKRAEERAQERAMLESLASALSGKVVHITASVSKGGTLYASIHEKEIAAALQEEFSLTIPVESITIKEPIKTVGKHSVAVLIGAQSSTLEIEVKASETKKK